MQALCAQQFITGFPTIRVFRHGSDKVVQNGFTSHESYHGDRTADALEKFVDDLVTSAGKDPSGTARLPFTRRMNLAEGCKVRSMPVAYACAWFC
jgi:hypothetical protein